MPRIHDELRRLAAHAMQGERPDHTLQPTALVPYLGRHRCRIRGPSPFPRDGDQSDASDSGRSRAGEVAFEARWLSGRVPLTDSPDPSSPPLADFIALDSALTRLAEGSQRRSRVVELHYIGGLTLEESAVVLGVSTATVHHELKFSRAWLQELLHRGS